MTSMLHSLASTFTTCACGAKARDCVLNRIAEFVENQTPLTPSPSPPSQFAKEKEKQSGKSRKGDPAESSPAPVDLGPLVGVERGFKTRERIPSSGGMGGVEMVPPSPSAEAGPSRLTADTPRRVSFPDDLLIPSGKAKRTKAGKGKGRAQEDEESDGDSGDVQGMSRSRICQISLSLLITLLFLTGRCRARRALSDPEAMDVDAPPPQEECLPPRLRKAWIAKSLERLRVQRGDETSNDGGESRMDECCFGAWPSSAKRCVFTNARLSPPCCRFSRHAATAGPAVTYASTPLDVAPPSPDFRHIFDILHLFNDFLFKTAYRHRRHRVPFSPFL